MLFDISADWEFSFVVWRIFESIFDREKKMKTEIECGEFLENIFYCWKFSLEFAKPSYSKVS